MSDHLPEDASPSLDNPPPQLLGRDPIDSQQLFQGKRQVLITHGNEVYRLLHTKNGKLILQK